MAAEGAVTGVFVKARHKEVEEMVQSVAEKAWKGFGSGLALEKQASAEGRELGWVGWFVRIAINLLRDERRRERTLVEVAGRVVPLAGRMEERSDDGVRTARRVELADTRWGTVEEHAEWAAIVSALHTVLGTFPLLQRRVLLLWGRTPKDTVVAKTLGIKEKKSRELRRSGIKALRPPLEAMGYTAENRPRQPEANAWGFYVRGKEVRALRVIK